MSRAPAADRFDAEYEIGRLGPYVRYLADNMRLRDWQFVVEYDPVPEHFATIECVPNRQLAVIRVGRSFFDLDYDEQRHDLCHELVHPHHNCVRTTVAGLEPVLGAGMFQMHRSQHDQLLEQATDNIAASIACLLPNQIEWEARQIAPARLTKRIPRRPKPPTQPADPPAPV